MNTRTAVAALAVLAALTLTGCAAAEAPAGGERLGATSSDSAATESAAPLVAETPAAGPSGETVDPSLSDDPEDAFLAEVRTRLGKIRTQIPDATDEQLVTAAHQACEALAPNLTGEDLSLIQGETRTNGHYMDSSAIIVSARLTICPIES